MIAFNTFGLFGQIPENYINMQGRGFNIKFY